MKLHLPKGLRAALIAAISLFSGLAATMGSAAYADSFLPSLTNDAGNKAIIWKSGTLNNGWNANLTATGVAAGLKSLNMTAPGWYNFVNNGQNAYPGGGETSLTETGFRFNGRQLYGGEAVVATVSVADILAGTADDTLTSLSISFDGTAANNGIKFSVWAWDGTTATSLVGMSSIAAGTFDTKTFSASDLNLTETDSIIFSWYNSSPGAQNTINNLATTFTSTRSGGTRDLTWDLGTNCNWGDEVWTLNGGKTTFEAGDNIYFPKLDTAFRRISVDGDIAVGDITVQAGNDDYTTIAGKEDASMTAKSLTIGANGQISIAGFSNITIKTLTTGTGAEADFSYTSGTVTISEKLTDVAENTIILAINEMSGATKAPELHVGGNYKSPDELTKAIKSVATLQALSDKGYIAEDDVRNMNVMGTIIFTDKQPDVQPGGAACSIDIDLRKVVFDKGIALIGNSLANGSQSLNVKNYGEMTVNGAVFDNKRMTVNVNTGGKLTATEGITLGHQENGNYGAWLTLKYGQITTQSIKGQNNTLASFTMGSESLQLDGAHWKDESGTLTITGDSAFGLTAADKTLTVNLGAGTLTSTATAMNLVEEAYADNAKLAITVSGDFNVNAQDGKTITLNHAITGTGTLVFSGTGTVAIADGLNLGNVSFNQTDGTVSLAGAITLGDGATFTQAAGKKIVLAALGEGGEGSDFSNYVGGADGNGILQSSTAAVISGGTINGDVVVSYNGKDYTLNNDNRTISGDVGSPSTYFVNTASADMSKIAAFSSSINKVKLAGGNLILDEAPADSISLQLAEDSTLTINEGVSVNKADIPTADGKTLTLAGAGILNLGASVAMPTNTSVGADWQGMVVVDGLAFSGNATAANSSNRLNDAALSNANSCIGLTRCTGWLEPGGTVAANLKFLTGDAVKLTDGSSGRNQTFSGKITGDGDFVINMAGKGVTGVNYIFSGDVSEWSGAFKTVAPSGKTFSLKFTGAGDIGTTVENGAGITLNVTISGNDARTINGSISGAGTTNLTINGTGDKTFAQAVTATDITSDSGTLTFNGALEATSLTINAGGAVIKDTLTVNGTLKVGQDTVLDLSAAGATTATALQLFGGSSLTMGASPVTVSQLTLINVSDELKVTLAGVAVTEDPLVLFTGLVSEDKISNIEFTTQRGKRATSAGDYFAGLEDAWLVYNEADSTLSVVSTLSKNFYWVGGDGTWNADGITWSKTEGGEATNAFTVGENAVFAGTDAVVTLDGAAGVTDVTFTGGNYTLKGDAAHIDGNIRVENATVVFETNPELGADTAVRLTGAESSLTFAGDAAIKALNSEGLLDMDGHALSIAAATANGGTVKAGSLQLTGDNTFTKLDVTGAVTGASALTLQEDSAMGSLGAGTALAIGKGTTTIGDATALKSLDNGGTLDLGDNALTIASGTAKGGIVKAGDVKLAGDNTFTKLTASGEVTGAAALTVGDGSTMGAINGDTALTVGGTVTVGGDSTIKSLENNGTLDLGDKALSIATGTDKGGIVKAGDVKLAGDNTFTKLTASGAVTGADSLTLGSDSTMASLGEGTALTIAKGTTTIGAATSLKSLENHGTLDLGNKTLTIATGTDKGGIVSAGDIKLAGDNTFTKLSTYGEVTGADSLTLGSDSFMGLLGEGTALTIAKGTTSINDTTSLKSLENHGTLDLGDHALSIATGTAHGGIVYAGDIKLTGDNTFSQIRTYGTISGADSLTVGDNSFIDSISHGTDLHIAKGDTTIVSDVQLGNVTIKGDLHTHGNLSATSLTGSGDLNVSGDLTLAKGGSIGALSVSGGTLTVGGPLTVSGMLTGVNTLVANELPVDGPVLSAGAFDGDKLTFATMAAALDTIDITPDTPWLLAKLDLTDEPIALLLSLDGAAASTYVSYNDFRYTLSVEDGNVMLNMVRSGNEWKPTGGTLVWDGTDDMWTGGAPSETKAAFFQGSGPSKVQVISTQTAKTIIVDCIEGNVDAYTLTGDDVRTGSLLVSSGGMTIDNHVSVSEAVASGSGSVTVGETEHKASLAVGETGSLSANHIQVNEAGTFDIAAGGHVTTDTISIQDGAGFSNSGTLEIRNGNLALKQLADNKGTVAMKSLNGGKGDTIGGHVILQEGGSYTGAYKPGTQVDVDGAGSTLKQSADANLAIGGAVGTHVLKADATHKTLAGIQTTGADIVLNNMSGGTNATIKLGGKSSMKGGSLKLSFSAAHAAKNSGNKGTVARAFTGAALDLSGVDISLTQTEPLDGASLAMGNTNQTQDVVIYSISDAAGSTFDRNTTLTVNAPLLGRYFTNFRLKQGSINVVADRELNYYGKRLQPKSDNGKQGIAMAGQALGRLAPQEGDNRKKYQGLAAVMDALDHYVETKDSVKADKLAAAFAGAAVTTTASAFSGDMDRQLRSLRNRTMIMGASDSYVLDPGLPTLWFNTEGNYLNVDSDGTKAGVALSSFGGTVGTDYNINSNWAIAFAATAMYGHMSVSSPEDSVRGTLDTYYASFILRHAKGRWVNSIIGTFGIADATLDRTVDTGYGSYTTDGSTSGTSFGLLYELAYTIPMNADSSLCLQPVFNVAYKHVGIKSYMEKKSDAALSVGSQTMDSLTVGAGARMQTTLGETLLNRTSVLEARALVKVDLGDRSSSADVSIASIPESKGTVKGASSDAFGLEVGAGLYIPVGVDHGTLFFDLSADLRVNSPNVTGTVGYRVTF